MRTHSFAELSRAQLENVLDMLDGRYPSRGVRRAAPADRLGPRRRHDPRAQGRPRAGDHQRRHDPRPRAVLRQPARRPARRRARRGDGLRGASRPGLPARRVELADRGDHARPRRRHARARRAGRRAVLEGRRRRPAARAGRGDRRVLAAGRSSRTPTTLADGYDLDPRAAQNLLAFLREQQDATRVVPSDRTIVVERFRDEIGDWRLCVLSPYGGRVHAAWGLALSARIREEYGLESDAIWSDDGIIVHLPDADEPPGAELVLLDPDELEDLVVGELGGSALFGARFRENAGRALLIPRAYPGRRTPLWQQRLKSQTLLEVAKRYGQFPIVLETYRECLRDVLDVPGLQDLLRKLHSRELSVVEVETPTASPFASSLLFDYVATYMYEGDTPNAERRAAALALDRDLLRELLGQEELRDLIDPGALESVEADLQRISERTRADSADALHDVLRRVGDLTPDELRAARASAAPTSRHGSTQLGGERRAIVLRDRRRGALGRGRGRGALSRRARRRPAGRAAGRVPRRRARRDGAARTPLGAHARAVRGTPAARPLRPRPDAGAGRPRARGRAGARRAAPRRHRARVVRPRGAAAAAARLARGAAGRDRAGRPARARALRAQLAGRRPPPAGRRRRRPAARDPRAAPGPRAPRRGVGARRAAAPRRRLLGRLARPAVRLGRGRLGRRRAARPAQRQGRALLPRGRGAARPPAGQPAATARTSSPSARTPRSARGWRRAPASSPTCWSTSPGIPAEELQDALWDLVWAGEATNDAFAPLRSPRQSQWGQQARADARAAAALRHAARRRPAADPGPLVADRAAVRGRRRRSRPGAAAPRPSCCSSATGSSRASTCWPRASAAASRRSMTRSRRSRRSASASAATSSRDSAAPSSRCRAPPSGCAPSATTTRRRRSCSPRPTRRSPTAACSAGRRARRARPPARRARTSCWPALSRCSTSSAAARACRSWSRTPTPGCGPRSRRSRQPCSAAASASSGVEKVNGEPVMGSPWEELLIELGFRAGPRKLTIGA